MNGEKLDGPRLQPEGGVAKKLVILLHGYGSDGARPDRAGIMNGRRPVPGVEFVAPNAPQACEQNPMGYEWFSLNVTDQGIVSTPEERLVGAQNASPTLNQFIADELNRLDLEMSDLALAGFSQGAMMALHVGLQQAKTPAAIVSFSGMLLDHESLSERPNWPPVLLAHGSLDEVVPFKAMHIERTGAKGGEVPRCHLCRRRYRPRH